MNTPLNPVPGNVLSNLGDALKLLSEIVKDHNVKVTMFRSQVRVTINRVNTNTRLVNVDTTNINSLFTESDIEVLTSNGFNIDMNKDFVMFDLCANGFPGVLTPLVVKPVKEKVVKVPKEKKQKAPKVVKTTDVPTTLNEVREA